MKIATPAKINLFLNVLGKRDDGYHEVETILQKITIYDTIILKEIDRGIKIRCSEQDVPTDEKNLAYQAAYSLLDYSKITRGVEIEIIKKIPVAAGLGGGSSDAAATLLGLNRLWETGLSQEKLIQLACRLGADVPFFLGGQTALGKGRGDELTGLNPLPQTWLVLAIPTIKVSTAWVYKNLETFRLTKKNLKGKIMLAAVEEGNIEEISQLLYNSLEAVTISHYPIIAQIKKDLLNRGAIGALMSGSGPTVFGIFLSYQEAKKAYNKLKGGEQITYILTSTVERPELGVGSWELGVGS